MSNGLDLDIPGKVTVGRSRPRKYADGTITDLRANPWGEPQLGLMTANKASLVDEGTYYVVGNPTIGTALAFPVAAAFADTAAAFAIFNPADAANPFSPTLVIDYLRLNFTVAPATATGTRLFVRLDNKDRTPSAGRILLNGSDPALSTAPGSFQPGPRLYQSVARIYAFTGGAQMTVPAVGTNGVNAASGGIDGIPVVGGSRTFRFGEWGGGDSNQMCNLGPLTIPPQWWAIFHLWFPGNATTGASIEPELGYLER